MNCPDCGTQSRIFDSRNIRGENATRRRHACPECNARWTTVEIIVEGTISSSRNVIRQTRERFAKEWLRELVK